MFALANPARFQRLARRLSPLAAIAAAALLAAGLYFAILASPADYQQGETVRIMYVHVPAAWMALAAYTAMAGLSVAALIWRHSLADIAAQEIAPIGAGFTLIALVTGALWGRPMWGAYWVWDARLTSVLILFFLFMGHIALARAFDDPARGARAAAILAVVGWINIPVIKFSVEWWNTLHQPASVMRLDGPTIDPAMLLPLGLMAGAFLAIFAWIALARIRARLIERRLEQRLRARAEQA